MIEFVVNFLKLISQFSVEFVAFILDATDTWPLLFGAISIVLITRYILGPILGFTFSGASDMVKSRRSKSSKEV